MKCLIVMGVSGAGKTTVGVKLADKLGWAFIDGDDYHSDANRSKMAAGTPLTNADRKAWIDALIEAVHSCSRPCVVACSALNAEVRRWLASAIPQCRFVWLRGSRATIGSRLAARRGHFFDPHLLESQFVALEPPDNAIEISIDQSPDEIVEAITSAIGPARSI